MSKIVHLHCLWQQGPKAIANVSKAIAYCGAQNLQREQVTSFVQDATCPRCTAKAKEAPPLPAPVIDVGKPKAKAKGTASAPATASAPTATASVHTGSGKRGRQAKDPWPYAAGAKLHLLSPRNPCKQGTPKHKRWSIVFAHEGKTWEKYRDAGGNPETLRNAIKDKFVEIVE